MAKNTTREPRAWQRMLSGRRLDLLAPSLLDVEIDDIAHGLARVARWNGQTHGKHAFSVAQHSVFVWEIFCKLMPKSSGDEQLMALLHDAPEYVIGDMISPFKAVIGGDYKGVEQRLLSAIHLRYSLPAETPVKLSSTIKKADTVAAYFEATELAGFAAPEAILYFGRPRGFSADMFDLEPKPANAAHKHFMKVFGSIETLRSLKR